MIAAEGKRILTDVTDIGRSVITSKNASELNQVITDLIEGVAEEKEE